jgi:hypothetical protein
MLRYMRLALGLIIEASRDGYLKGHGYFMHRVNSQVGLGSRKPSLKDTTLQTSFAGLRTSNEV